MVRWTSMESRLPAVLAVDRVVAVLVVAGVLLVGRGGGRSLCDELESEPSELSEPFDWDCDCSSCDFSVSPELPAYASSIGAALDSPHPASSAPATTSPAAANVADFFNVLFSVIFTLLKPPLTRGAVSEADWGRDHQLAMYSSHTGIDAPDGPTPRRRFSRPWWGQ